MSNLTRNNLNSKLNDFLKGIYMGKDTFERFKEKCNSSKLKNLYNEILSLYDKEAKELSYKISLLRDKSPAKNVGITGKASEFFYNLKTINLDSDSEILEESKKSYKTGLLMMEKFIDDNKLILTEEYIYLLKEFIKEVENLGIKLFNFNEL